MLEWAKTFISGLKKKKSQDAPPQYLYRSGWDLDSREHQYGNSVNELVTFTNSSGRLTAIGSDSTGNAPDRQKMDERIAKKPVDVYREIIPESPAMNLVNLDGQIKLVERRMKMFTELGTNSSDEYEALGFLRARKAGLKIKTNFHWAVTTLPMIEQLIKKYKLSMVDFGSYAKNVPMEAVDELENFLAEYTKVRDDKPVLRLIIDDAPAPGQKSSLERKKDPILLASSPFGRFYYILGAWDKEVQVVDDLVYHGK